MGTSGDCEWKTLRARSKLASVLRRQKELRASTMNRIICASLVALLSLVAAVATAADPKKSDPGDLSPAGIFRSTNIWTIHLSFTSEQWEAMEPKPARGQQRRFGGNWLQGPEGGRNGLMAAQGINFDYVRADLEFGTSQFKDVGVRYKGNGTFWSSRDGLKRSLKVDFNQFVKGQKLAGMSQLNLHNSVRDRAGLNEALAYRVFRDGGVPAPRTAYARVYVTVPGKHEKRYFGLYNLVEDVGGSFAEDHFKTSKGALLKPVTPNLFADLGDDWKNYNQTYDPKGRLSDEQKQRIIEFCKFTTTADEAEFAKKLGDFVDLDNFARYLAITTWLADLDGILGPGQNYYVYLHPKSQKFMFIPWDQDQSFGQFPRGSQEQRENLSIQKPWSGENGFLAKAFRAEPFKDLYLAKMREFNESLFQPARITPQVAELADVIRDAIREESTDRLTDLENTLAGKTVTTSVGPGFNSTVKSIMPFVEARTKSVKDQLEGKSAGQTIGPGFGR
ncbi:MAG: CotH kinase family protein [Planctomycetia bacterium]|nr:CotH kinase family protein [Planctomycetia bacterium]